MSQHIHVQFQLQCPALQTNIRIESNPPMGSTLTARGVQRLRLQSFDRQSVGVLSRKLLLIDKLKEYVEDGKFSKLMPELYIPRGYILPTDISCARKVLAHPKNWSEAFLAKLIDAIVAARANLFRLLRAMKTAVKQRRWTTGGPRELVIQDLKTVEEFLV